MAFLRTLLSVIFLLVLVWASGFAVFTALSLYQRSGERQATDAIVVLTGGDMRIESGLQLLASKYAPVLFISGVHADVTVADIQKMWKWDPPLPGCCIELGHKAHSTIENAQETHDWAEEKKIKSLRLVTSNYHMNRALMEFRRAMPKTIIVPNPVTQPNLPMNGARFWRLMLLEYHKTIFRYVTFVFDPAKIKD